jgi:hypothetical protein
VIDRFNDERLRCKEQALWAAYYLSKTGNYSLKIASACSVIALPLSS